MSFGSLNISQTASSPMMLDSFAKNSSQHISKRHQKQVAQISKLPNLQETSLNSHQIVLNQPDGLQSKIIQQASTHMQQEEVSTHNYLETSFQSPTMTFTSSSSSLETSTGRQKLEEINEKLRVLNKEVSEKRIEAARMSVEQALFFNLDWAVQIKRAEEVVNCCKDERSGSASLEMMSPTASSSTGTDSMEYVSPGLYLPSPLRPFPPASPSSASPMEYVSPSLYLPTPLQPLTPAALSSASPMEYVSPSLYLPTPLQPVTPAAPSSASPMEYVSPSLYLSTPLRTKNGSTNVKMRVDGSASASFLMQCSETEI